MTYGIATGARREGVYTLTVGQLHPDTQIIDMRDKGKTTVPAPVSAELIAWLAQHAIERGGACCDPASPSYRPDSLVFYYQRSGCWHPLTSRRFDGLHERWHMNLDWAKAEQVGFHRLRHTIGPVSGRRTDPSPSGATSATPMAT